MTNDYLHQYAKAVDPLSEHGAFVKAIHAGKGDPLPALVYADWLDEHDNNGAAELIRQHHEAGHSMLLSRHIGGAYGGIDLPKGGEPFVELYTTLWPGQRPLSGYEDERGKAWRLNLMHHIPDHTPPWTHNYRDPDHKWAEPIYIGHGLTLEEMEAHRLLSQMPNVYNADRAKAELERRYPWLRGKHG